jgi:predicted AAA+ superfamily ATPase
MLNFIGSSLIDFIDETVSSAWNERNFVSEIRSDYLYSRLQKVLIISGLRRVGKTVGIITGHFRIGCFIHYCTKR